MYTYRKSTVRVLRMAMHLTSAYVTLLTEEFQHPEFTSSSIIRLTAPGKLRLGFAKFLVSVLFRHTTPILKSLHWLKVNERIEYKILSLTFKLLYTAQPPYLYNLISLQPPRNTRSSSVVTLARPPTHSSLEITSRSFRYASPHLWNQLPLTSSATS